MLTTGSIALTALLSVGSVFPTIPTLEPAPPETNGIVAAEDGTIYFVDSFRNTVWRVRPGGTPTEFVTGRNGRSLQIAADGSIYGTHRDSAGLSMWRADPSGAVAEVARPSLPEHYGSAFVIADESVIGYSGTGRRSGVRLWREIDGKRYLVAGGEWGFRDGPAAEARFYPIGAMARTSDGGLLVTSGPTVRRIASDGTVSTVASNQSSLATRSGFLARLLGDVQGHLTGIANGNDGTIFVTNSARGTVVAIDPAGMATVIATSSDGWSPTGVTVVGDVLYVLEYGPGVRVRKIVRGRYSDQVIAQLRPGQRAAVAAAAVLGGRLRRS